MGLSVFLSRLRFLCFHDQDIPLVILRMVIRIAEHGVLQGCFQFITAGLKRQICNTAADHAANNGNSLLEKARESCFVIFTLNHFATLFTIG